MSDASGQRQRAEAEVEKLLQFIEATSGRKLRFRPICNLNTGKQESPSERLACWYEKIVATARQEALREAAERLGVGDANGLLEAPCLWCGYNGEGYYQAGTHGQSCPWHTIGGCDERLDRLAREGVK